MLYIFEEKNRERGINWVYLCVDLMQGTYPTSPREYVCLTI